MKSEATKGNGSEEVRERTYYGNELRLEVRGKKTGGERDEPTEKEEEHTSEE